MKLVQGEERHLPETPDEKKPFYVKFTSRFLSSLTSQNGMTHFIGVMLFVLLTITLSFNYLDSSKYIDENGISLQDFFAESRLEVINESETNLKIEREKQKVPLIYKNQEPINQSILENFKTYMLNLQTLEANKTKSDKDKRVEFFGYFDESADAESIISRILKKDTSPEYWEKIRLIGMDTLQKTLKTGITLETYLNERDELIQSHMPRYGLNKYDYELVSFVIEHSLQPNQIVDEEAMTRAREEAAAQVEPVKEVFKKGERVVSKGEEVSKIQVMALQQMGKSVIGKNWVASLGVMFLTLICVTTLWGYLYFFDAHTFYKPRYALLIAFLLLTSTALFEIYFTQIQMSAAMKNLPVYAFPLGALALILSIFTHYRVGILTTVLFIFLVGMTLRVDFYMLSVLLFGCIAGIYNLSKRVNVSDRSQLMYTGLFISLTNGLVVISIHLLTSASIINNHWSDLVTAVGWSFANGFLSFVLTLGILPLLESLFGLVTPYTLMELSNHDKPLLKKMQFEAPGTFHHSLMVASLAEAAAEGIGANALLTRVGCLYHDIGKMKRPLFFIENQAYFGADNPHDKLTPRLSKMVITAHPRDSIEMGRHHGLPDNIMKFMTEHHGTMATTYFYNKACQEEGPENVNKSQFRYPGPKPQSRETAIVMLADACESAVRALKTPTAAQIEERIDKIIEQRIEDGQFDECPITFRDLSLVKQTFLRVLRGIQHNRIEYQENIMRDLGRKTNISKSDEVKIQGLLEEIKQGGKSENTGTDTKTSKSD